MHMIHMMFVGLKSFFDSFWPGKKNPVQRNCKGQKGDETSYTSPRCLEMRGFCFATVFSDV